MLKAQYIILFFILYSSYISAFDVSNRKSISKFSFQSRNYQRLFAEGENTNNKIETVSEEAVRKGDIQGFQSSDLKLLGEGKQLRVGLYIALALLPCLLLLPFFMSRDFVPSLDN